MLNFERMIFIGQPLMLLIWSTFAKNVGALTINSLQLKVFDKIHCGPEDTKNCPKSCADLQINYNMTVSGVYYILPKSLYITKPSQVYCDLETDRGGWTIMQRRGDYNNPHDYFYRGWEDYKNGFGDPHREYWIGNLNLWGLTLEEKMMLRIDLEDWDGNTKTGETVVFRILSPDKFEFFYKGFKGTLSNSLPQSGTPFSTIDRDNDSTSQLDCAKMYKSGWWFTDCMTSNLNGLYLKGEQETQGDGISWTPFKGVTYSLKSSLMMIRPRDFQRQLNEKAKRNKVINQNVA